MLKKYIYILLIVLCAVLLTSCFSWDEKSGGEVTSLTSDEVKSDFILSCDFAKNAYIGELIGFEKIEKKYETATVQTLEELELKFRVVEVYKGDYTRGEVVREFDSRDVDKWDGSIGLKKGDMYFVIDGVDPKHPNISFDYDRIRGSYASVKRSLFRFIHIMPDGHIKSLVYSFNDNESDYNDSEDFNGLVNKLSGLRNTKSAFKRDINVFVVVFLLGLVIVAAAQRYVITNCVCFCLNSAVLFFYYYIITTLGGYFEFVPVREILMNMIVPLVVLTIINIVISFGKVELKKRLCRDKGRQ